jgi:riboflavin synthase
VLARHVQRMLALDARDRDAASTTTTEEARS